MLFLTILLIPFNQSIADSTDDIVGQWRNVVKNPSKKNTVAKRYMRHTFFKDGTVEIENKEDSIKTEKWKYENGLYIINSSYEKSKFTKHYKLIDFDKLSQIRFKSIIDGKSFADYDPKEKFIRQGSATEKKMKIWNIFKTVSSRMDFIDPTALTVGTTYSISKKTPIMPHYESSDLNDLNKVVYIQSGGSIKILEKKHGRNVPWYKVESDGHSGWVNSIALIGQKLEKLDGVFSKRVHKLNVE